MGVCVCVGCTTSPEYSVDAYMTSRVTAASLCEDSTLQCLACDCKAGLCYVVLKKKSLGKKRRNGDSIKCPVHDRHASEHVQQFYKVVETMAKKKGVHGIVWDWCDVPQDHHMHVDATVFCEGKHCRFEIDGENHFVDNETARICTDAAKDAYLAGCGAGMLRLHYRDKDEWSTHISSALENPACTVVYTPAYIECLEEHENVGSVAKKRKRARRA